MRQKEARGWNDRKEESCGGAAEREGQGVIWKSE